MVDKINVRNIVYDSRYNLKYYLTDGSHIYQPFLKRVLRANYANDSFYKCDIEDIGRLDLVASKVYGNPFLWWVIATYNNIYNPFTLKAGVVLRIPNISKNGVKFFVNEGI